MNSDTTQAGAEAPRPTADYPPIDYPPVGERELQHVGGRGALRQYGIPVPENFWGSYAERVTVRGADGHQWEVWCWDVVWFHARRPMTPAEWSKRQDDIAALSSYGYINKPRVDALAFIAREIETIAISPLPRSGRRKVKQRLEVLAEVSTELLVLPKVSMAEIRTRLAGVGVIVPQPNYQH